jgi:hypothetical protein
MEFIGEVIQLCIPWSMQDKDVYPTFLMTILAASY